MQSAARGQAQLGGVAAVHGQHLVGSVVQRLQLARATCSSGSGVRPQVAIRQPRLVAHRQLALAPPALRVLTLFQLRRLHAPARGGHRRLDALSQRLRSWMRLPLRLSQRSHAVALQLGVECGSRRRTKQHFERRHARRVVARAVVRQLHGGQQRVPVPLVGVDVRAQRLDERAVLPLRLSVRLRVERRAAPQVRAHGRPQVLPEMRREARVAVGDDGARDAVH